MLATIQELIDTSILHMGGSIVDGSPTTLEQAPALSPGRLG